MPKINTDPNQSEMFTQSLHTPRIEFPVDIDALPPEQKPSQGLILNTDEVYPSVDLVERAKYLDQTLADLGKHGRSLGLQMAGAKDSPLRKGVEARYGTDTDQVVEGAYNTGELAMKDAKRHFAKAIGMEAVIAAGVQTEKAAKESAKEDFDRFTQKYTGPSNEANRRKIRQTLNKTHKTQAEIRGTS